MTTSAAQRGAAQGMETIGEVKRRRGRPPLAAEQRGVFLTIRIEEERLQLLDSVCTYTGETRSQAIERAVRALLVRKALE